MEGTIMNELVSIVIPVYGVEDCLNRCLESVVNQDYRNLEIILVDDGSPDRCPEMCDEWASKDDRIKVVHKPNGGLASARNAGLSVVAGDVVTFIDSDDWVEPNLISTMLRWKVEHRADVCVCGVYIDSPHGRLNNAERIITCRETGVNALTSFLYHERFTGAVWAKMFNADYFTGKQAIRFHDGLNSEDYYVLTQVYSRMNAIYAQTGTQLYHYWQREGSICHTSEVDEHTFDEIKIAELCCEYLKNKGYGNQKALNYFLGQARADVLFSLFEKQSTRNVLVRSSKELRKHIIPILVDSRILFSYRLKLLLVSIAPCLCRKIIATKRGIR